LKGAHGLKLLQARRRTGSDGNSFGMEATAGIEPA
jgi:hypothetical protein